MAGSDYNEGDTVWLVTPPHQVGDDDCHVYVSCETQSEAASQLNSWPGAVAQELRCGADGLFRFTGKVVHQ